MVKIGYAIAIKV